MVPRLGLLLALPLAALSRRTYKVGYQSMTGAAPHYAYDAAQEKYVGAYPDLMDLIAQELDVDTVDVYVGPWFWKPLFRGEADIIFFPGPMNYGFYYTSPVHSMTFHGLLKATSRNAEYWSLFDPFHWRLWLAIGVTVILGTVVAGLIAYLERAWDPREDPLEFGAMLYHSVTLLLGGHRRPPACVPHDGRPDARGRPTRRPAQAATTSAARWRRRAARRASTGWASCSSRSS